MGSRPLPKKDPCLPQPPRVGGKKPSPAGFTLSQPAPHGQHSPATLGGGGHRGPAAIPEDRWLSPNLAMVKPPPPRACLTPESRPASNPPLPWDQGATKHARTCRAQGRQSPGPWEKVPSSTAGRMTAGSLPVSVVLPGPGGLPGRRTQRAEAGYLPHPQQPSPGPGHRHMLSYLSFWAPPPPSISAHDSPSPQPHPRQ